MSVPGLAADDAERYDLHERQRPEKRVHKRRSDSCQAPGKVSMSELHRITLDSDSRPSIRGMRIRVKDVLELLASGASREEILTDFPYLEPEDITATLEFGASETRVR